MVENNEVVQPPEENLGVMLGEDNVCFESFVSGKNQHDSDERRGWSNFSVPASKAHDIITRGINP